MKLLIPEQSEPTKNALPNQPRKLKKVLAALPNANMGELTKQVYQILRELNRQTMPASHRLENMEALRVSAREVFSHLKKYFINRTLPLPEKSKKIINLNQALLQEMAYGYKSIILDIINSNENEKKDSSALAIACCRSIRYLSELLLRSSEVYALPTKCLWSDAHQIYFLAENYNLLAQQIEDNETTNNSLSIENCYKQMLLFTLARPIALRQSDSERVFLKLEQWADHSSIKKTVNEKMVDKVFYIKINEDLPPDYLSEMDLKYANAARYLDADELVTHLNKLSDLNANKPDKLTIGDEISPESLKMLIINWGTCAKRRYSRSSRIEKIEVSIGLSNIVKVIAQKQEQENNHYKAPSRRSGLVPTDHIVKKAPEFTLESIQNEGNEPENSGYMTHSEIKGTQNNSWDMVARGTALTETYENEQKKKEEAALNISKQTDSHWEVVNFSAGGYRLRWNSDGTSRAQIGELIALYEKVAEKKFEWRIGIIRWMQFTQENGLEIGIQVISPKIIVASVQRANRLKEAAFDCLLLPSLKALKQVPSMILPSHAFKAQDKLVITLLEKQIHITLTNTKENTGSFTQFHYIQTKGKIDIKKVSSSEQSKTQDDFDEIWSSI